ncbi:MAG TPA: pyruvate, phosphate dikinase [Actinomycetaceae bacterium]|nr:pyruvate, phosphate dikinase [Actinomycetaceae bacterium]
MTKYVYMFSEGNKDQKDLLGGKGANLAEMTNIGLPVPPGFIITTDACRYYMKNDDVPAQLAEQVTESVQKVEQQMGRTFGDPKNPLLVSVRSGAKFSMPGMMETVLNIGLNDETLAGIIEMSGGNERFAWDSYRRLLQMFGKTVLEIDGDKFADALDAKKAARGIVNDPDLTAKDLSELVDEFKAIIKEETGEDFPQDARTQLDMAVVAVFNSWNTERAIIYRKRERIADDLGTAVNVQTMVYGNLGEKSGTGVCFTRDPATGQRGVYGDYLENAQGEDVVAGIRNTLPLAALEELDKKSYDELLANLQRLENHYRDMCDIEFTVENGKLYMLQTRIGKRTAAAAFRIAVHMLDDGLISEDEALERVTGAQLTSLMFPQFDADADRELLAKGMAASPGAAVGEIVFDSEQAVERKGAGAKVILVRRETTPDDLAGMIAAAGILTSRGGKTSHAAVVARGMGTTAVVGAEALLINAEANTVTVKGKVLRKGDVISIDGGTGEVFAGDVPVAPSNVTRYFEEGLDAALEAVSDEGERELVTAVHRFMTHADEVRRMGVRANADTPEDARRALAFGAEGIGLTRTEHMFLGDRREMVEHVILADSQEERDAAFNQLTPLQRGDFAGILEAMDGQPVTIRLIDPPLHEFLPDLTSLAVKRAINEDHGISAPEIDTLYTAVNRMHEANPMLGLRGVRLGLKMPGLFDLQVRAIAEACVERIQAGGDPQPEIMVPLVGDVKELTIVRERAQATIDKVAEESGVELSIPIGAMMELPRAAVTSAVLAEESDFFSFGTNDLTQTVWGFSRDDVEGAFFTEYMDAGIFEVSPFESIDVQGVGELVRQGVNGSRSTKPDMKLGVCGEHGGDPDSIHFFEEVGLDYVSCSPFRVPIARLEAARAMIEAGMDASA